MCQSKSAGGRRCPRHHPASRAMITAMRAVHDLDMAQAHAVFTKTYDKARAPKNPPSQAKWEAFCDKQIQSLALDLNVDANGFAKAAQHLHAAKAHVPGQQLWATYQDYEERMSKAVSAVRRQINSAAAFQGVTPAVAAERFEAFRAQYQREFANRPAAQRPAPPEEWVRGFTTKDMMAVSAPADPATLYALYRCQADPDAFPDADVRYASIDLETAGPAGKDGFEPTNGSIIEVGIVEYDTHGNVTGRYETLVAPAPEVAKTCGTGAVDVHGITLADVADAPGWQAVAPEVAQRLHGRVMLAQNARFEREWLKHHMGESGQEFDAYGPTVDTYCVAKQHFPDMERHKLQNICEQVGVAYTDGHRAMHDAEVAAQAFFKMRDHVHARFRASTVHGIPAPALAPKKPFGAPNKQGLARLTAGDFSPATIHDPWATPAPAMPTAVA